MFQLRPSAISVSISCCSLLFGCFRGVVVVVVRPKSRSNFFGAPTLKKKKKNYNPKNKIAHQLRWPVMSTNILCCLITKRSSFLVSFSMSVLAFGRWCEEKYGRTVERRLERWKTVGWVKKEKSKFRPKKNRRFDFQSRSTPLKTTSIKLLS